jgi:hypothetical protein
VRGVGSSNLPVPTSLLSQNSSRKTSPDTSPDSCATGSSLIHEVEKKGRTHKAFSPFSAACVKVAASSRLSCAAAHFASDAQAWPLDGLETGERQVQPDGLRVWTQVWRRGAPETAEQQVQPGGLLVWTQVWRRGALETAEQQVQPDEPQVLLRAVPQDASERDARQVPALRWAARAPVVQLVAWAGLPAHRGAPQVVQRPGGP